VVRESRGGDQDLRSPAGTRLPADGDLDVAVERRQEMHQPLDGGTVEPVIGQRWNLGLLDALRSDAVKAIEGVGESANEKDERGGPRVTLDLEELDLVDIDAVRFLNACESAGVSILHCSPNIREWMLQERSRPKDDPEPF
jgi:hypothetical protein